MKRMDGMRRTGGAVLLTGVLVALGGCDDGVGPNDPGEPRVSFSYADGTAYEAEGMPVFDGGDLQADAFAIAFADSTGGLVITGFRETGGTRGDLFVLQLVELDEGEFGPCGTGQDCHGRLLEDIDAANLSDVGAAWEMTDGTVEVDDAGPERVTGSFQDLVLAEQGGTEPDRTIESGTFDLPLLSSQEGVAIMQCFLTRATGGSCEG